MGSGCLLRGGFAPSLISQEIQGLEMCFVWSSLGQSPLADGDRQGNAGKSYCTQPSQGKNQSSPLELCSEPDLGTVINALRCSWESTGDGNEWGRVEGRDKVLAPKDWDT